MLKVGLTGGIGSGKTLAGSVFRALGVPVYLADDEAKRLMQSQPELISSVRKLFGPRAYVDRKLNREYIGGIVFNDHDMLKQLNALVHPAVQADFEQWSKKNTDKPYVIEEAALLFEAGAAKQMDYTVFVRAGIETRIERVINRDHVSREHVLSRIRNQMDAAEKEKWADFVIINEIGSMILPQIVDLHQKLLNLNR